MSIRRHAASALLFAIACGRSTEPQDRSPIAAYDQLVSEFDARYPTFALKGIDWRATAAAHRANLTETATDAQVFDELSLLLAELRDTHVQLITPIGTYRYIPWLDRPVNFFPDLVVTYYVGRPLRPSASGRIAWGRIGSTGYIRIASFSGAGWAGDIDAVLDTLSSSQSIVVDVRSNGGGNDQNSTEIAQHFLSESRVFARTRVRSGPLYSDLGPFTDRTIAPGGQHRYARRVAVLTNRGVFSSAESFVLMMRQAPNAIVIGDTTGGASANPLEVKLVNGWTVWISRWIEYPPTGETFEGVGIIPDVPVWLSASEVARGHDTMLDSALARLY